MSVSVEVPQLGESVTEAIIGEWHKQPGDFIAEDEILVSLETDKVAVEVPSPVSGVVKELRAEVDDTINVGDVIAVIEPGEGSADSGSDEEEPKSASKHERSNDEASGGEASDDSQEQQEDGEVEQSDAITPAVARLLEEHDLKARDISASGPSGRLLKGDVLEHIEKKKGASSESAKKSEDKAPARAKADTGALEERKKMSPLRKTIARRLVEAQQETAMLTTFNEVDMTQVMAIRKKYQDQFVKRHGTKLGFMSFFTKAAVEALKEYPAVNAVVDGTDIVYKNYYHVSVAIGGGKGLVVPVMRDVDQMSFAEIELEIKRLAELAQTNKLKMEDLQGGTFTISNGGIYGSMMSTPILNRPQSGILGMHNITPRPVVVDGEIVVRPMMYLALSYDHRIVDGREAVSFLVRIKECIENPERILFEV